MQFLLEATSQMLHQRRTALSNDERWCVPASGHLVIDFLDDRLFPGQSEVSEPTIGLSLWHSHMQCSDVKDDGTFTAARPLAPDPRGKSAQKPWSTPEKHRRSVLQPAMHIPNSATNYLAERFGTGRFWSTLSPPRSRPA